MTTLSEWDNHWQGIYESRGRGGADLMAKKPEKKPEKKSCSHDPMVITRRDKYGQYEYKTICRNCPYVFADWGP